MSNINTSSTTLNALKQIQDNLNLLSKSETLIASFTLKNPLKVSSISIQQLAKETGVSVATVNRFAQNCGFSGFSSFKKSLQNNYAKVFEPVEKAKNIRKLPVDLHNILNFSFQNSIENLKQTIGQIQFDVLNHLIDELLNKKRIFVAGMGISALHAAFFVDALEPFLPNTYIKELVSFSGTERAFRQVANLNKNDLVIVLSLPRYSRAIVDLTRAVRQKKVKLIAITDSIHSPLVPLVDHSLFVSVKHPVLYASNTAVIALIEAITLILSSKIDKFEDLVERQTQTVSPFFYHD